MTVTAGLQDESEIDKKISQNLKEKDIIEQNSLNPLFALGIKKYNFFRYIELLLMILLIFGIVETLMYIVSGKVDELEKVYEHCKWELSYP